MKKISLLTLLLAVVTVGFYACNKDEMNYKQADWKQTILAKVTPSGAERNFLSEVNLATNARSWSEDKRTINFDIDWSGQEENPVAKVDVYAAIQETTTSGVHLAGGIMGKMLTSVTSFDANGKFAITVSVDQLYDLLKNDFEVTARPNKILPTDLIELKWVVTGIDGQMIDSRSTNDCFGEFCSYAFGVTSVADIWGGTFDYEYIQVGAGVQCCTGATIPKVKVGTTGTMTFVKTGNGLYTVADAEFGASWNGALVTETLNFNFNTGAQSLTDTKAHAVKWSFSNNKGNTIDLKWVNKWEVSYGEWGVVRLTRTDGVKWPTNLK